LHENIIAHHFAFRALLSQRRRGIQSPLLVEEGAGVVIIFLFL